NALPAARPTTDAVTTPPVLDLESTQDHVIAGSWFELMLTTPRFPTGSAVGGGLDERLVALMNRSRRTLDVAIYEFNLRSVADAMAHAADRGVRVRMVTDSDTIADRDTSTQAALDVVRQAGIPIVPDNRRPI